MLGDKALIPADLYAIHLKWQGQSNNLKSVQHNHKRNFTGLFVYVSDDMGIMSWLLCTQLVLTMANPRSPYLGRQC